ncbi:MAG: HypC/HybG/HupF family hydrogenase formation chaperone [Magnetococcales bacterium]|nr:HypC/HybG/HupF family hydrogenase formation chaperone [Magnetococcales bacterium]
MCLAVPMQIVAIRDDELGTVELDGVRHEVSLMLIDGPQTGDYVLIHAGYAIERLDTHEADERLKLFRHLAALHQQETGQPARLVAPSRMGRESET